MSITRNRAYMHSDVGTTIIENEKGEEQSQQNEKNVSKNSEEKDITMMDKQLNIRSNEASAVDYGIHSYNSSTKLNQESEMQQKNDNHVFKNRLFSAGNTMSHHSVQKFSNKSKMDISNNDVAHDILQSRTKLTPNDRYQSNGGPTGNVEKRPTTANPTNHIL